MFVQWLLQQWQNKQGLQKSQIQISLAAEEVSIGTYSYLRGKVTKYLDKKNEAEQ